MWQVFFTMLSEKKYQGLTIHKIFKRKRLFKKVSNCMLCFFSQLFCDLFIIIIKALFQVEWKSIPSFKLTGKL